MLAHLARTRSFTSVQLDLLELVRPPLLLARLRSFDEIVSWYGTAREEFRAALEACGVPFRLLPALPPQGADCHAVDFYLRQVGLEPDAASPIAPRLDFAAQAAQPASIAIHPFSGSARKNWDLASFRRVADRLTEATGLRVVWLAGPDDDLPQARRFPDLESLGRYLSGAALYLGNDSGITHLAAACGVAVIAIFQASDPNVWAPRGPRVTVLRSPAEQAVFEAALRLFRTP